MTDEDYNYIWDDIERRDKTDFEKNVSGKSDKE